MSDVTKHQQIWFTADTHFAHESIIKFCGRPFYRADEMDEELIRRWNEVVSETDIVYHLGDFCFGNGAKKKEIGYRLNGYKHLIRGSHDAQIPNGIFESIGDVKFIRPKITGKPEGQGIYLSHYLHKIWDESHYGSWHLCGHSHGRMNAYAETEGKIIDVGVDNFDFYPISLDTVIKIMESRPDNFNMLERLKKGL